MKAAVYSETGPPSVLRYEDVPDPSVGLGTVLVRNQAISIEGGDVLHRSGGELGRVPHVVGYQSAGTVEAVGPSVTDVTVGDEVVGWCSGAYAEYAVATSEALVPKPPNLTFEQAAALGIFGAPAMLVNGELFWGNDRLVEALAEARRPSHDAVR